MLTARIPHAWVALGWGVHGPQPGAVDEVGSGFVGERRGAAA